MRNASLYLSCLFFLFSSLSIAIEKNNVKKDLPSGVTLFKDVKGEIQLRARQAPLSKIINQIIHKTGVKIHYSAVSETLVTITCSGTTVRPLLECLFGSSDGFIIRYAEDFSAQNQHNQIDEVWLLSSVVPVTQFQSKRRNDSDITSTNEDQAEAVEVGIKNGPLDSTQIDKLLTMAQDENPKQRSTAIATLVNHGSKNNANIASVFKQALSDNDANVRALAVHSLAHFESDGVSAELQQALLDDNASVRLMALGSADNNNTDLLHQALTDTDETVRQMAEAKLEANDKLDEEQKN